MSNASNIALPTVASRSYRSFRKPSNSQVEKSSREVEKEEVNSISTAKEKQIRSLAFMAGEDDRAYAKSLDVLV